MDIEPLQVDRQQALDAWKKYQTHRYRQTPEDAAIASIYKAIAGGKLVIPALAEIKRAGLDEAKLPKLAITRADEKYCYMRSWADGSCTFSGVRWINGNTSKTRYFQYHTGSFPNIKQGSFEAMVPLIPIDIRPKRGLPNYHVLWEPVWEPSKAPVDPMLLRRMGDDLWIVLAAWDLTRIERTVMEHYRGKGEPR